MASGNRAHAARRPRPFAPLSWTGTRQSKSNVERARADDQDLKPHHTLSCFRTGSGRPSALAGRNVQVLGGRLAAVETRYTSLRPPSPLPETCRLFIMRAGRERTDDSRLQVAQAVQGTTPIVGADILVERILGLGGAIVLGAGPASAPRRRQCPSQGYECCCRHVLRASVLAAARRRPPSTAGTLRYEHAHIEIERTNPGNLARACLRRRGTGWR